MRIFTLLCISFSLFPSLLSAIDPTSIPLLITLWTSNCSQPLDLNDQQGLSVVPSNHPCWRIRHQIEPDPEQYYGSRLHANGTLTLYQYYWTSFCKIDDTTIIHHNITIGKCIPGTMSSFHGETPGISLDWAPSSVTWTGVYSYQALTLINGTLINGCTDTLDYDRPIVSNPGYARQPDICYRASIPVNEYRQSQKRILDTSTQPYHITECTYTTSHCSGKADCAFMQNYPIGECTSQQLFRDAHYYWTVFGKPIETITRTNFTCVVPGQCQGGTNTTETGTGTGTNTATGTGTGAGTKGNGSESILLPILISVVVTMLTVMSSGLY